jgi:AcrR family transcriptional regulator
MKDSREHILKIAFELFMQKSFKEVTMKEIVTKTGLSKGAFYHYFESKEQLFMEIIDHYFKDLMNVPFEKFSHESLKQFCEDYLKDIEGKAAVSISEDKAMNVNFYFLIFDAIRMVPAFKEQMAFMGDQELKGWLKIIRIARKKGEIKPAMTDEQIAKFYMYSNDGIGIRMILDNRMGEMKTEIKSLWDGFYKQLKG